MFTLTALIVPPTRLSTVGDRVFPTAAASRIWNSLSLHHHPYRLCDEEAEAVFFIRSFQS